MVEWLKRLSHDRIGQTCCCSRIKKTDENVEMRNLTLLKFRNDPLAVSALGQKDCHEFQRPLLTGPWILASYHF